LLLGGTGAEQLQRADPKLGSQCRVVLSQHRQHVIAAGAGGDCRGQTSARQVEMTIASGLNERPTLGAQSSPLNA
jgi:hypothetical protein